MKLIVQSDDYGISEGVIFGVLKGVQDGVLTCVGMFSNMPCSQLAARLIRDKDICLGIDINICTGPCVSDPVQIPTIAKPDGMMYTKKEHCGLDAQNKEKDHMEYEECVREVCAQVERFKELVGRYPVYMNGHSYHNVTIDRAVKDVSVKYGIPMADELAAAAGMTSPSKLWYKRPFPFEEQISAHAMDAIRDDKAFLAEEYGRLIFHCGYIDPALMDVSTFSLIRVNDLRAVISQEMKDWIKDNSIELITYNDIK